MPARILAVGDPHIQVSNIPEVNLFIERMINLATEKKPDLIVILGDVLHTHERLNSIALNKAYELIDNMRLIAKTYVLVGNHDMCLGKDIPVLLWNGETKMSQNIQVNDILINDEGNPCRVQNTVSGIDEMYLIEQIGSPNYIVNQHHILSLKCTSPKYMYFLTISNCWVVRWINKSLQGKTKYFGKNYMKKYNITMEKIKKEAEIYLNSIESIDIIDIPINKYLNLPTYIQRRFFGYRLYKPVNWPNKKVLLEPYIFGSWLGDGNKDGSGFASTDVEIILKWCQWSYENGASITHTGQYNYGVRNIKYLKHLSVDDKDKSSDNCVACQRHKNIYGRAYSLICANIQDLKEILNGNTVIIDKYRKSACKQQIDTLSNITVIQQLLKWKIKMKNTDTYLPSHTYNPLRYVLKKLNLYNNKHIPLDYIINDENTRLQVLAGLIDADGCLSNDLLNLTISHGGSDIHIIDDIEKLVRSLGFECVKDNKRINKKTKTERQDLCISGNIENIPIILQRKKGKNSASGHKSKIKFNVKKIGVDNYYGFSVNENNRFLINDWVSVHNCNNQQYLSENHWLNGMKEWKNTVIVDKVVTETINREKFVFCPYVYPGRFVEALDTLHGGWKDASAIFAHQEFAGCKMGAIISVEGDKWLLEDPHIISGHIHSRQIVQDNVYYPGAALQHAFGESEKNIIPYLVFDGAEYEREEIDLGLPRKKIIYMDVEDLDEYKAPDTEDKIKVTVSGSYDQFKALKKTKKYKKLVETGVKVVFKPKKIKKKKNSDSSIKEIDFQASGTDFKSILGSIITNQKNPYLTQAFELVVNGKETSLDDIIFL
jgi:hypothetical protein